MSHSHMGEQKSIQTTEGSSVCHNVTRTTSELRKVVNIIKCAKFLRIINNASLTQFIFIKQITSLYENTLPACYCYNPCFTAQGIFHIRETEFVALVCK